jgi:hypothetical protein
MDLKDFVRDTIIQIMTGVEEAQERWKGDDKHGAINPIWNVHQARNHMQEVCFDVAVSAQASPWRNTVSFTNDRFIITLSGRTHSVRTHRR